MRDLSRTTGGGGTEYSARVSKSAHQVISDSVNTTLSWQVEQFDNGGFFNAAQNDAELIVPAGAAGRYIVGVSVQWGLVTGTVIKQHDVFIRKNGISVEAQAVRRQTDQANYGQASTMQVMTMLDLVAGDGVSVRVFHAGSGGTLQVEGNAVERTHFWMVRVGP